MKKSVIFYFSGTGNTWWVTGKITALLNEIGIEAVSYAVEQVNKEQANRLIEESDLVGFGYPVHSSDVPEIMKNFMQELIPAEKEVFIYCTQWIWSGDGARVAKEFLPGSYRIKWAEHFAMPNNVSVSAIRLPYTNDKSKISLRLKRNEYKIQKFVEKIASDKLFLRGFNRLAVYLGYIQRGPFRRVFKKLRDDISVDTKNCSGCGYCVKLCPTGNLYLEDKMIKTQGNCIICLRCYSFCPAMAVKYMNKPHNAKRGVPYRGPVDGFDPREMLPDGSPYLKNSHIGGKIRLITETRA